MKKAAFLTILKFLALILTMQENPLYSNEQFIASMRNAIKAERCDIGSPETITFQKIMELITKSIVNLNNTIMLYKNTPDYYYKNAIRPVIKDQRSTLECNIQRTLSSIHNRASLRIIESLIRALEEPIQKGYHLLSADAYILLLEVKESILQKIKTSIEEHQKRIDAELEQERLRKQREKEESERKLNREQERLRYQTYGYHWTDGIS